MPPKLPALLVRGMNSAPPSAETAALSGGGGAVLKPPKGAYDKLPGAASD